MLTTLEDLRKPRPEIHTRLVYISCEKIPGILEKGRECQDQLTWDEKMVYEAHTNPYTKLEVSKGFVRANKKHKMGKIEIGCE